MKAYELRGLSLAELALVARPEPRPKTGQVLLKMRAVGLNARDRQIIAGHYPIGKGLPLVPLSDGVGEVVAVGAGVTRVAVGDRVAPIFAQRWLSGPRAPDTWSSTLGADLDGLLQEFVVLHEDGVVPVPPHLTDAEGATLGTAGVAAWHALVTQGRVAAGDYVLIQGTGSVSLFALQFALLRGARAIVTSGSPKKLERARALGATAVLLRTEADWVSRVRDLTQGHGVDHVIDVTGDLEAAVACLRIGGLISQIGYLAKTRLEVNVIPLLLANARLQGISVGPRSTFEDMNRAIGAHALRPIVARQIEFAQAAEAFSLSDSASEFGKTIVTF